MTSLAGTQDPPIGLDKQPKSTDLHFDSALSEVVQRIVEVAQPERIILFGSLARRQGGKDSDIDLLVVKDGVHRRQLAQTIYQRLVGVGVPVDVVVATQDDIVRYSKADTLILKSALEDGLLLYERE